MSVAESSPLSPAQASRPLRAGDFMSRPAVLVESREELASIVDVMLHTGFTTLPVVDADGRLVKLITEDSVAQAHLVHLLADKLLCDNGVDAAAEPSSVFDFALAPASVELDSTLTEIIEAMLRMGLRAIPVVRDHIPVGIISWRDIFSMIPRESASRMATK